MPHNYRHLIPFLAAVSTERKCVVAEWDTYYSSVEIKKEIGKESGPEVTAEAPVACTLRREGALVRERREFVLETESAGLAVAVPRHV